SACRKDKDDSLLSQLPEATTEGLNTAGCIFNGEVLVPKGKPFFPDPLVVGYRAGYFGLGIVDRRGEVYRSAGFSISDINKSNYSLVKDTIVVSSRNSDCNSKSNNDLKRKFLSGYVNFTRFDTDQCIVSGTFAFKWVSGREECDTITITDGRFDIKYEYCP
ncbi:MAG: hypothetical protein ACJAZ3_000986, partial [Sphingobacteriales bacterium]